MTKIKVDAEDLEWILTMKTWEFTDETVKKTEEVEERLWMALGHTDKMERTLYSAKKRRQENEGN